MQNIEIKKSHAGLCSRILDSVADGVITVDKNLLITYCNSSAEKITGIKRKNAIGKNCYEILDSTLCNSLCAQKITSNTCSLKKSLLSGEDGGKKRISVTKSDGSKTPLAITTSPLRDYEGDIIGGIKTFRDLSTVKNLRNEINQNYIFEDIVSKNYKIQQILTTLPDIASSGSTVLIEGPSGSGKELFAKAIHKLSQRKGEYITLNCAALPDNLLESELFGYEPGAFTDAKKKKPGRFALAEKGTLFLDEIGDISPALQLRLLRVLQEKEYEPLGATASIKSDVRIVTATNKHLKKLVDEGQFRDDLFYRLNVVKIKIPPLKLHREDIPLLVDHFIQKFNLSKSKDIETISPDVLNMLMRYEFPGNIRELENIIEYAFVLCHTKQITEEHLPLDFAKNEKNNTLDLETIPTPLKSAEGQVIIEALENFDGSRTTTARFLGIEKTTLWRKMKKLGIKFPRKKKG